MGLPHSVPFNTGDFTVTKSEDTIAIRQLAEDWRSGWLAGDTDALLALYADDPVLMPWGQQALFGKDAIRQLDRQQRPANDKHLGEH